MFARMIIVSRMYLETNECVVIGQWAESVGGVCAITHDTVQCMSHERNSKCIGKFYSKLYSTLFSKNTNSPPIQGALPPPPGRRDGGLGDKHFAPPNFI